MPYIKENRWSGVSKNPDNCGELNFKITRIVIKYVESNGGLNYSNLNEVIGLYENIKIEQNGDVYPSSLLSEDGV